MKIVHLDFETRSRADLNEVGSYRYAEDPSTEILMAAVSDDAPDAPVYQWINQKFDGVGGIRCNPESMELLRAADLIYVHGVHFEFAVTMYRAAKDMGWTPPPLSAWRCTEAMCRKAGIPDSLEDMGETLKLPVQKDAAGKALIRLFSTPQKERKTGRDLGFTDPAAEPEKWAAFCRYNVIDVQVQKLGKHRLKAFDLSGGALDTFQFDLRMNWYGMPVNVPALPHTQRLINVEQGRITEEFRALTGLNPTQREKVQNLLAKTGCPMPNMQAATVEGAISRLESTLQEDGLMGVADPDQLTAQRILDLYQKVSYTAVKKVQTMLDCANADGRVRGSLLYYGAGTGRWAGRLVQPQNFKKTPKHLRKFTDAAYADLCAGRSLEYFRVVYGDYLEVVAAAIRHFIDDRNPILDGDYNAIEARMICWLSDEREMLEMWRSGRDLYKWMAALIYDIPEAAVTPDQREVGKRVILGAGYQMGPDKFHSTCKLQYQLDLPMELCERGINTFRQRARKIVGYWYYLNEKALEAVAYPGRRCGPFVVRSLGGIPYLLFYLRSGRALSYPWPKIEEFTYTPKGGSADSLDEDWNPRKPDTRISRNVTYWGEVQPNVYGRVKMYGGKWAENESQATAADVMAHGAITAEERGYRVFTLIHDQALSAWRAGQTAEGYASALATLPVWAPGLPLKVEAKITPYYRK